MSYKTKVKKTLSISVFHRITTLINGIVITAVLARYIGPEEFGRLNYILSLTTIAGVLVAYGSYSYLQKTLPRVIDSGIGKVKGLYSSTIKLQVVITITCLVLFCILLYRNDEISGILLIVSAAIIFLKIFEPIRAVYEAELKHGRYLTLELFVIFLFAPIKLYMVYLTMPAATVLTTMLMEIVCIRIIDLSLARKYISVENVNRQTAREALSKAKILFPYFLVSIAGIAAMRLDQVMLFEMRGLIEVGLYSVAVRLAEGLLSITSAVLVVLLPLVLNRGASDEQIKKIYRVLFGVSVIGCAFIYFLKDYFISMIYGGAYEAAAVPFFILSLTIPVNILSSFNYAVILRDLSVNVLVLRTLTLLMLNVSLNIFMIPYYGTAGAAVATLIANVTIVAVFDRVYQKVSLWK